ncbi:MAG: sigma-70 family RNA polymerase sigma factor [Gemmataceae bacterium]|nr:sigma-70 family RNA polymerase sigma factor [Gemmataceae bacterium]
MEDKGSVTRLIDQLHTGDAAAREEAAAALWQRYCERLVQLARRHLDQRVRRREDENDVLQSMYKSFCLRIQEGRLRVDSRDGLWRLLVRMTINKARHAWTRHTRAARDVGREQAAGAAADLSLEHAEALGPGPDEAAELTEGLERLLRALADPRLCQIVLWKLEGYTNEEIAAQLGCVVRTVERKLHLIRRKWEELPEG